MKKLLALLLLSATLTGCSNGGVQVVEVCQNSENPCKGFLIVEDLNKDRSKYTYSGHQFQIDEGKETYHRHWIYFKKS